MSQLSRDQFLLEAMLLRDRVPSFDVYPYSIPAVSKAVIYQFSDKGIEPIAYEETEHFRVSLAFLTRREKMLAELFDES